MSDSPPIRPVVRLRPQSGRGRRDAPWAYADEVVLDRRTRAISPGAVVELQDAERRPLGCAAFNPGSKIAARLLDPDPAAAIDAAWFAARIGRALALREALFDAPFYRLAHAEADGLPGVVIDRFGPAAAVQPNAAWAEVRLPALVEALRAATGVATVVKNAGGRARGLEGLDAASAVLVGALDGPVPVRMNGAVYFADLAQGQKTGIFYDQRPNHAFAARLARGRSLLDVFSHVGGFALAGLAAGATAALAVDASAPALELAALGAAAGGVAERLELRRADAFEAMAALGGERPAVRAGGLRSAGLRAEQGGAGGGLARLRAGGAAGGGAGRAGRVPGALLVQPRRGARAVPRGEPARGGAGRTGGADPARRRRGAGPSGAPGAGGDRLSQGAVPAAGAVRVALDACVLFPTVLREMLLGTAAAGGFVPLWSARILEEWARATRRLPEGAEAVARGEIALMRAGWPEAEVAVDPELVARLSLPDPDDRHVLAAAIAGRAEVLLTLNRADFPTRTLARHGLILREPDGFLSEFAAEGLDLAAVAAGVQARAERASGRPQPLRALHEAGRSAAAGQGAVGRGRPRAAALSARCIDSGDCAAQAGAWSQGDGMAERRIFGLSAALVTPFAPDGAVDLARLARHAAWVLQNGCDTLTLFGTTGEGFSIGMRDRAAMLGAVGAGGIDFGEKLYAAVTATSVEDAVAQARLALGFGARGLLVTPPYYLKGLADEGLYAWFARTLEAIGPALRGVVLYHIPGQTAVPLSVELVGRLRRGFPEAIVGVKDSSGDWATAQAFLAAHGELAVLIGDERLLARAMREGAQGSICGLANFAPGPAAAAGACRARRSPGAARRRPGAALSGGAGGEGAGGAPARRSRLRDAAAAAGRADHGGGGGAGGRLRCDRRGCLSRRPWRRRPICGRGPATTAPGSWPRRSAPAGSAPRPSRPRTRRMRRGRCPGCRRPRRS